MATEMDCPAALFNFVLCARRWRPSASWMPWCRSLCRNSKQAGLARLHLIYDHTTDQKMECINTQHDEADRVERRVISRKRRKKKHDQQQPGSNEVALA